MLDYRTSMSLINQILDSLTIFNFNTLISDFKWSPFPIIQIFIIFDLLFE